LSDRPRQRIGPAHSETFGTQPRPFLTTRANPPAVTCLLESYHNRPMTLTGYAKPQTFIVLEAFDTIA
jgi:hypothetical protein